MSTSWQWFPEIKTAICCYCGFTTIYAGEFPGNVEHECDPGRYAPIATPQGQHVGRSLRPDTVTRMRLDQVLACIHRGPEVRQASCTTCSVGTRIKVFACSIHNECQLEAMIGGIKSCGTCDERSPVD